MMLGDGVSRAFMRALVQLIGGYRDSLKFNLGERISFDAEAFIQTRPASVQPFLETMLHLQIFQQVIFFSFFICYFLIIALLMYHMHIKGWHILFCGGRKPGFHSLLLNAPSVQLI